MQARERKNWIPQVVEEDVPQEVHLTEETYETILCKLFDEIGENRYFSGHIDFYQDSVECRLVLSVVVYRKEQERGDGSGCRDSVIVDLVPVWWECHSAYEGVEPILNDFSFSHLRYELKMLN